MGADFLSLGVIIAGSKEKLSPPEVNHPSYAHCKAGPSSCEGALSKGFV